jgi:SAM-dependent methyltransferase
MAGDANPQGQAGWEEIWRSGDIPPRYRTQAAPEDWVVEWAETLPAGGAILDLGCGVGRHCVYLGGRGFRMAGQDISPSGVEQTSAACAGRGIPFEGKVSDMSAIPWGDATFDGALSIATIHHQLRAGIAHTLGEMRRVLKPGGALLIDLLDTNRPEFQEQKELAAQGIIKEVEPNTFVNEQNINDFDGFLPHHFSDEADVRDLLRGFEIVRLWTTQNAPGQAVNPRARWVAIARKPLSG